MARGGRGGGGKGGNAIYGTSGNDILDGLGASYYLSGGKGDDTYYVDDTGDTVDEKKNAGIDHVISQIDYTLAGQVENLTLAGSGDLSGTGNDSANVLTGNLGVNTLYGLGGDDTLSGGGGSDLIDGGAGDDTAVFAGLSTDYSATWVGDDLHLAAADGSTDVLRNVEFLQFDDGIIAVADIGADPDDLPAPQAVDDADVTAEDSAAVIAVLNNDIGQGLAISSATNGAKGLVTVNDDGTVTYQPNANAFGADSFTYTITDALGRSSTATVSVDVASMNDAPVAGGDGYSAVAGGSYASAGSVLVNDTDVDGDALSVVGAGWDFSLDLWPGAASYQTQTSAGGSVTINADGTFTYMPAEGFTGTDSFTYAVGDGNGAHDVATVTIAVAEDAPPPYYVEALLYDDPNRLNYPDAAGSPTVVTFSFLTDVPDYYGVDHAFRDSFVAFSEQQEQAIRDILALVESLSGLTFVETPVGEAGLTLGMADLQGFGGLAYRPYADGVGAIASDVWIDSAKAGSEFIPGGSQYLSVIHEIGHALGLDHPSLPAAEENQQYTIMNSQSHLTFEGWAKGYQLFDIAALQYLYGANMNHATGDDNYGTAALDNRIVTIWDAGGHDTLDLSDAGHAVSLDLAEGAFSTVAAAGTNNVAIAFGTVIEDAVGGAHDDSIAGNDAANRITGGPGDDLLTGRGGADTFGFGPDWGNDTITDFASGVDQLDFRASGLSLGDLTISPADGETVIASASGSITLHGIEVLIETDLVFA